MSFGLSGTDVTDDAFLGDSLSVLQPRAGYRAGIDAVLLAATVAPDAASVLDAGAGVGVVGLCVARRLTSATVTLVERDPDLAALARDNVSRNGLMDRVQVIAGDIAGRADELQRAGLPVDAFDAVLANPPFHVTGHGTPAAAPLKAASHAMASGGLEAWVRFAARAAKPGASFTLIHKADALAEILTAFARRFGGVKVKPVYARAGEPAIRVIVQGIKGSRAPLDVRAPLVLHGESGHGFSPEVAAVLRNGVALAI